MNSKLLAPRITRREWERMLRIKRRACRSKSRASNGDIQFIVGIGKRTGRPISAGFLAALLGW